MDTVTDGRLDIVIFPNGGKEYLAKLPSSPAVDEQMYLDEVARFVAAQNLEEPTKFTGTYRVVNDKLQMTWGPYAGEPPKVASEEAPVEPMSPEAQAMMAQAGWTMGEDGTPQRINGNVEQNETQRTQA